MEMPLKDYARVLELCRQARQLPSGKSGEIAGTLLRLTKPGMPPRLLRAANDAIFFAITHSEADDAIPLDQLSTLTPDTDVFVPLEEPGTTPSTEGGAPS